MTDKARHDARPNSVSSRSTWEERLVARRGLIDNQFIQKIFQPRRFQVWQKTPQQGFTRAFRDSSKIYHKLVYRYQPPAARIQQRFGPAISAAAWKPLKMTLPGEQGRGASPEPAPFQALQAGLAYPQSLLSTQAPSPGRQTPLVGQIIPRKEDDPDYAPNRPDRKKKPEPEKRPKLTPNHRLFSRIEEVIPGKESSPAAPQEPASQPAAPREPEPKPAAPPEQQKPQPPVGEVKPSPQEKPGSTAVIRREPDAPSPEQARPSEQRPSPPERKALPLLINQPVTTPRPSFTEQETPEPGEPAAAQPLNTRLAQPPGFPAVPEENRQPASLPQLPRKHIPARPAVVQRDTATPAPRAKPAASLPQLPRKQLPARPAVVQRETATPAPRAKPAALPARLPARTSPKSQPGAGRPRSPHAPYGTVQAEPGPRVTVPAGLPGPAAIPPVQAKETVEKAQAPRLIKSIAAAPRSYKPFTAPQPALWPTPGVTFRPVHAHLATLGPRSAPPERLPTAPIQPSTGAALTPSRMAARPVSAAVNKPQIPAKNANQTLITPFLPLSPLAPPSPLESLKPTAGVLPSAQAQQGGVVQREFLPARLPDPHRALSPIRMGSRPHPGGQGAPSNSAPASWRPSRPSQRPVIGTHRPPAAPQTGAQASSGSQPLAEGRQFTAPRIPANEGRFLAVPFPGKPLQPPPPPPGTGQQASPEQSPPPVGLSSYSSPFESLDMPLAQQPPRPPARQPRPTESSESTGQSPEQPKGEQPQLSGQTAPPLSTAPDPQPQAQFGAAPQASPAQPLQEMSGQSDSEPAQPQPGSKTAEKPDLDQIASQVYPIIMRKLRGERERHGGRFR